ncbi:ABC transporter substrate-binding protein [Streptomyces sp. DSM 42041]|uniref:ABC transporter substrate-binding protein n=1 Tax=Streptomyces hazeniae TaxID=3075538 RepID=A0ABU2NRJ2_9ACTN|nr:ABC transporter substrate-binding protein [Streptomyces sp. DSM 42041]MDT0379221.1 ABC transporter substrate-binding protein [Streptomyces sp. DSM 42041]
MNRKTLVLPALLGLLAPTLAACGGGTAGDSGGDAIVVGTTDRFAVSEATPAPFDPAAGYDIASWNVMRSTFQTLLRPPRSGTEPEPEAARECAFTDKQGTQYRCTLREGMKFSDGSELTAQDVEFSVERMLDVGDGLGPASLLGNVDTVQAAGDTEVVFHLKKPDATFPYKLATPAAAILDSETYPRNGYLEGTEVVGSGPYLLESYDASDGVGVFVRNPDYTGTLEVRNDRIELRSFDSAEAMEKALKNGEIDVMNRTLTPGQVNRLKIADDDRIDLVESPGQEIRYLVFHTDDPTAGQLAVRRAIAQVVDRKALVRDVYERTAEPLYSLVPSGLIGHRNSFFNEYGEPDPAAARRTLRAAGVDTPVPLTLHHTTDHYGAVTRQEFQELEEQLDATGLFRTELQSTPWDAYRKQATQGSYGVYGFGWFPDFADPDNFVAPFFTEDNFLKTPYVNEEIRDELIPQTRRETKRAEAADEFGRVQDVIAEEVPVLPLWQGKQYIAARDDITGTEWALNSASVLQLWELGRGVS